MTDKVSFPVYPNEKWKPGSYKDLETKENRHYGIKNPEGMNSYHAGTDIDMKEGDPVLAIYDGEVVYATEQDEFGHVVVVKHIIDNGIYFSIYGHLKALGLIKSMDGQNWRKVKRGESMGFIGSKTENGGFGPHLHYGIIKGEAFLDQNGNYIWSFFGYGLPRNKLNFNNPSLAEKLQIYGTLEQFGGNAIDPVPFMNEHLLIPQPWPKLVKKVEWNKTAQGSNDGRPYHWSAVSTELELPPSRRAIIKITASASAGVRGNLPPDKWADAAELWMLFNGVDLRDLSEDIGRTATTFRGSDLKGFTQEIYLLVDLEEFERKVPKSKRSFWENLWGGKRKLTIDFMADEKPMLKSVEMYEWKHGDKIQLSFFETPQPNGFSKSGIPFKSFVSLGKDIQGAVATVRCLSGLMRRSTDDDSVKIIVNNTIRQNLLFPNAPRYMNWEASGNQDKGAVHQLKIDNFKKGKPWNAMEIWIDNQPMLEDIEFLF